MELKSILIIPKIYKIIKIYWIKRKYSGLVKQIKNGKLDKRTNIEFPPKIKCKYQSFSNLDRYDKNLLDKLKDILLSDSDDLKDWKIFDNSIQRLAKKVCSDKKPVIVTPTDTSHEINDDDFNRYS